eukprot:896549-Prymnesium_polylepis.1
MAISSAEIDHVRWSSSFCHAARGAAKPRQLATGATGCHQHRARHAASVVASWPAPRRPHRRRWRAGGADADKKGQEESGGGATTAAARVVR